MVHVFGKFQQNPLITTLRANATAVLVAVQQYQYAYQVLVDKWSTIHKIAVLVVQTPSYGFPSRFSRQRGGSVYCTRQTMRLSKGLGEAFPKPARPWCGPHLLLWRKSSRKFMPGCVTLRATRYVLVRTHTITSIRYLVCNYDRTGLRAVRMKKNKIRTGWFRLNAQNCFPD